MRILVTGAAGFIGRALCRGLADRGHTVLGRTRRPAAPLPGDRAAADRRYRPPDRLVRAARRGRLRHPPGQPGAPPGAAHGRNGSRGRAALARAAASAGCGGSSISARSGRWAIGPRRDAPFLAGHGPSPGSPYGNGKLATERALQAAARQTGIELVILRPPLVYGPGVKGNFRWLLRLAGSGLPLPFAGADNRRSLIFIDNLVDLAARASSASRGHRERAAGPRHDRLVAAGVAPGPRRRARAPAAAFCGAATRFCGAPPASRDRRIGRAVDPVAAGR